MTKIFLIGVLAIIGVTSLTSPLSAQICVDQTCLIDRGATGEINLGLNRGGLAVLDYDLDGYPDLVIANNPNVHNRLFRNVPDQARPGNRTFADVTAGSGLDDEDGFLRSSFAVAAADFDNDGDADVFLGGNLTGDSPNGLLYRNDDGRFINVSVSSGIRPGCFHRAASWTDYNLDGWVDLFVVCDDSNPVDFILHENNRDGTFTAQPGKLPLTRDSLGISYSHMWTDFDGDGYDDGIILSALDPPILLKNLSDPLGGRRLVDVAQSVGFESLGPAPMGIAAGDYDNDGDFDFAISDAFVGTYYENLGGHLVQTFPFETAFSWGTTWLDVDNDGDLDHYQCGAHGAYARFDSLVRNLGGGQWEDISPALNGPSAFSQHSVQIDFNNDGRQDIITINPGGSPQQISVYENISTTENHWLGIQLRGDGLAVNMDAIGAVVRVNAAGGVQVRQVQSGTSTASTEDLRLHFGLGETALVDRIEVQWPARGSIQERTDVYHGPFAADQFMTLAPQTAACCVCPQLQCVENLFGECRALGGRRLAGASCAEADCGLDSPAVPRAPRPIEGGVPLSRYIGFVPDNPGRITAIRVTLESLNHPADSPAGADFSALEGQVMWVGPPNRYEHSRNPPTVFQVARLQCQPHFVDWSAFETVYVFGPEIVPGSLYTMDETDSTCSPGMSEFSEPLLVATGRWADVVAPFRPPSPSIQPDFSDVAAVVNTFRNAPIGPGKTQSQLTPSLLQPETEVNFNDVSACVDAFRGVLYPFGIAEPPCP